MDKSIYNKILCLLPLMFIIIMMRSSPPTSSLLHITLTLLLSISTSNIWATPYFEINNKYIQTGSYTVATTTLYGNTTYDASNQFLYTTPLTRAHSGHYAISTFSSLNYRPNAFSHFNFTNYLYSWTSTSVKSVLQGLKISGIYSCDSPYLNKATDIFTGIFYIQNYTTKSFNNAAAENLIFGSLMNNLTGGTKAYAFFNGINATATTNNMIDITLQASYPFAGGFGIMITSAISTPLALGAVQMTVLGFNILAASTWPFPALRTDDGVFTTTSPYLDTNSTFQAYNTFYGITGFGFTGQTAIDFSTTFSPTNSIIANSAVPFTHLEGQGIVFWVKECKTPTIYYMISNDTCYDICPNLYFQNSTSMLCQSCTAYDCLKCNYTQLCTLCDNVTAFRVLNTSTGRCDPMPGYYQNGAGNLICPPCDSNCLTCQTTSNYCLSCYPNFYLSSNTCLPCSANCNNCTSSTNCTNCTAPYSVDVNTLTCIVNCSLSVGNCTNCTATMPITCTLCTLGYYLNNTANSCTVSCGDGVLASTQGCDDGNNINGDGCSSTCTIQQSHFCLGALGSLSVCSNCSNKCLNCTSSTLCTLCDSITILNSSNYCIANCSIVTNCLTCYINVATVMCQTCIAGYAVNGSNMCVQVCGDGLILGGQTCDDNNTVDGDGCSSVCLIQTSFYCNGAPSICLPCSTYCSNCSSSTTCSLCNTLAILITTNSSCNTNCTIVTSCLTCFILNINSPSQYLQCNTCITGYLIDYAANVCNTICGDGLILGSQACDDNNTADGDGCSSSCTIQPAFYCSGAPSVCSPCLQYCYACTTSSDCSQCNAITIWDPANSVCYANCSFVNYCISCTVDSSSGVDYMKCMRCSGGYSVHASSNLCLPICGDGIVAPEQQCDDGNTNSGDGCSNICIVQNYFSCINSNNISLCQLSQLTLNFLNLIKNDGSNSGTIYYQPTPSSLPIYNNINWSSIISSANSSITITNVHYDPIKDQIVVNFDYSSTIQDSSLQLQLNTANSPSLSAVTPFNLPLQAVASDNQALVHYSDTDYTLATVDGYISLGVGAIAFVFLLAGTFAGRLIGLECAAVIQMSYLSILTLQNLSPGFKSLRMLSLCFGYNKLKSYDYSQNIERSFKSLQLDKLLIYNYNVMGMLVFAPLVGALICKLVAYKKQKQQQNVWGKYVKYCLGEYMMYILLSFCYLANLSLFIELKYTESQTMMDYLGITIGVLVIASLTFYLIFYSQADTYFTQFKDKFYTDCFSRRFYIFPTIERIVSPAILALAVAKGYGNAPIIGINALLAIIILVKSPYKGDRKNYRPFANYIINMLIQGIYLAVGFTKNPEGILSLYGPLIVLVLLLVTVIYSTYALVQQFKEKIQNCNQDTAQREQHQMKQFTSKFLREQNSILFLNRNLLSMQPDHTDQLQQIQETPSIQDQEDQVEAIEQLNFVKIKSQLSQMKNSFANANMPEVRVEVTGDGQAFKQIMQNLQDDL